MIRLINTLLIKHLKCSCALVYYFNLNVIKFISFNVNKIYENFLRTYKYTMITINLYLISSH